MPAREIALGETRRATSPEESLRAQVVVRDFRGRRAESLVGFMVDDAN